jgi:hypothetical protein
MEAVRDADVLDRHYAPYAAPVCPIGGPVAFVAKIAFRSD